MVVASSHTQAARGSTLCVHFDRIPPHDAEGYMWLCREASLLRRSQATWTWSCKKRQARRAPLRTQERVLRRRIRWRKVEDPTFLPPNASPRFASMLTYHSLRDTVLSRLMDRECDPFFTNSPGAEILASSEKTCSTATYVRTASPS